MRFSGPMAYRRALAAKVGRLALAAIFADDAVDPVPPDGASRVLYRKEIIRLTPDEAKQKYPSGLDCNLDMTDRTIPSTLVFRSSWQAAGVEQRAFTPPSFSGGASCSANSAPSANDSSGNGSASPDQEAMIQAITDRVMAALQGQK